MTSTDPRRGTVLVAVLWSISLLAALAMAASVAFRSFTGVMSVDRQRIEREALITAGLELAAGTLLNGNTALRDVELSVNLATGTVRLRLSDEGGRIDITKAPAEVLASLLRSVGAPPATADAAAKAIVEQRGTGNPAPRSPVPVPAPVVATTHEQALSGIGRIVGMRAQWLGAIAPLTTIYGSETVNPLTAPRGVIAALPGMDAAKVEAFLAERRNPSADANRLTQMLGPAQRFVAEKPQRVAAVDLTATASEGQPAAARAVITVLPRDSEPYRVLVFTPMPAAGLR
jgi:general secretion pathway protein K